MLSAAFWTTAQPVKPSVWFFPPLCDMLTSAAAQNVSATTCKRAVRDRGLEVAIVGPALTGLALAFVGLRGLARRPDKGDLWGWDDAAVVFAWAIGLPVAIMDGYFYKYGIGKDIWTIPFDDITNLLRLFYLAEIFYLLSTVATKLALLIFFLRVFPNRNFRLATQVMMGICIAFCTAFILPLIFQCRPINYAWHRWDDQKEGQCINVYAGIAAHAALNMILDLIILILPLPILFRLHTTYFWRQKFHILVMFSFGLIVTIISLLRLVALFPLRNATNITWDYWGSIMWSVVETEVGIICACLPAAKVVFARLLPTWFKSTTYPSTMQRSEHPHGRRVVSSNRGPRLSDRGPSPIGSTQTGETGLNNMIDLEAPASKESANMRMGATTPSDGGGLEDSRPTSTKQWS